MEGILSQLEIAFWNTIIPLMSESRWVQALVRKAVPLLEGKRWPRQAGKILAALPVLLFLFFSYKTCSIWLANHHARVSQAAAIQVDKSAPVITGLPTGQHNLLFITADDLKIPNPRLESAWLILFVPPDARLTLMPIYPASLSSDSSKDQALSDAFIVEMKGENFHLGDSFIEILRARNIWWSGYTIMDRTALAEILTRLSQKGNAPEPGDQVYNTDQMSGAAVSLSTVQNPQMALFKQATLYQEICWKVNQTGLNIESFKNHELLTGLSGHYFSDASSAGFLQDLEKLEIPRGGFFCEFPTIPMQPKASK